LREKIEKLPFTREFPSLTKIFIYPPKGVEQLRPTIIEGRGVWTLLFERAEKPNVASVKLVDAKVIFLPFSFTFDVDGDGLLEYIEVGSIELGPKDFDLEVSKGTLNLETGEFSIVVAHSITPESLPVLKKFDLGPLEFRFTERGSMNLETGEFFTEAGVISLPPPFEAIRIRAGECGRSKVILYVNCIAPPVNKSAVQDNPPENKEITICPGDPILLSWTSSEDVKSCEIAPSIGPVNKDDNLEVRPGPNTETVYEIKTKGGCTDARDTVTVRIFDPRKPLQFQASIQETKYSLYIHPESWSGSIRVQEVRIKRPEEEGYSECYDWPKFQVELWNPGEITPITFEIESAFSQIAGDPPAAGRWDFYPIPTYPPNWNDVVERKPPLCFAIKGECKLS